MSQLKEELKREVLLSLGHTGIDVELESTDLDFCIQLAFETYRNRSAGATEQSFAKMWLREGQSEYTLPKEIMDVKKLYRRSLGNIAGQGNSIDPFELAFTNLYLLQSGKPGGLLTYDLYHQFNETAGRMFGRDINFLFNKVTKKLTVERSPRFDEEILIETYNFIPDEILLQNFMIKPWLRNWAIAEGKGILAQIRGKYSVISSGPGGGTTLNAGELLQQSKDEKEQLLEDIRNLVDGAKPLGWVIG